MLTRNFVRWNSTAAAIESTLLLLRVPVVSQDLPKFQQQYYKYQNELWRRLMWTFPKWYYFREGTVAEQRFREINSNPIFNNPNLEYPDGRPEIRHQRDRRFKQDIKVPKTYVESEEGSGDDNMSRQIVPNSRRTAADEARDESSLERLLARTLYLVVSHDQGKAWEFPSFACNGQALHTSAEEGLYAIGGPGINYFNVSAKPCHVHTANGKKQFFIKLHILAGDFSASSSIKHRWLSKDELAHVLAPEYFAEIAHLLSEV